ncbi:MAG: PepSY-associated TM helix domain-containing protein [Bryobacteraceae bacterium]
MSKPATITRRVLLWLHMLVGLTFAVYAVMLGVSGSILVFREELTELEFPKFHEGIAPAILKTTPDQVREAVKFVFPDWQSYSVTWPNENSPYWMSYLSKGGQSMEVFLNPENAQLIGVRGTREGKMGTIAQMHFNLLLGSAGRVVQGFGIFALLAMCVSGLWLWWPVGGARLASRFRVDWRGGWRKVSWQLHHVTGAFGVAFIAMWAVTGGYYIWLNTYLAVSDGLFERAKTPVIEKRPADTATLPMAELARIAQGQFPGKPLYRMAVPSAPNYAVSVTMLEATPGEFHRVATVQLDPVTGAVLQRGSSAERPTGNSVLSWISVLHFGRFGGIVIKIVWFLAGLTVPLLAITGCLMWWRRVIEPRLRPKEVELETVA